MILGSIRYHKLADIPFCGNHDPDQNEQCQTCEYFECKDCTVSFDNLDNTQRLILHWYSKLDHMGFNQIKDLTKKGYLPEMLTRVRSVKYPIC